MTIMEIAHSGHKTYTSTLSTVLIKNIPKATNRVKDLHNNSPVTAVLMVGELVASKILEPRILAHKH